MREAQLDAAEEFDLLIVIICSRCSVAERIPEKQAGAEIVFMLSLYCFSDCLKTWVFSIGSNNARYFVHSPVHSRTGRPRLAFSPVWFFHPGSLRRNSRCSLQLKFNILLRKQVKSWAMNTRGRCGSQGRGVSYNPKSSFPFFPLSLIPAAANLKASHFSVKALCMRGGNVWGLINTKLL